MRPPQKARPFGFLRLLLEKRLLARRFGCVEVLFQVRRLARALEAAGELRQSRRVGERLPAGRRRDCRAGGAASARLHGRMSSRLSAFATRVASAPRWRPRTTSACRPRCEARIGAGPSAAKSRRRVAAAHAAGELQLACTCTGGLAALRRAARRAAAQPLSGLCSARSASHLVSRSVRRIRKAREERAGDCGARVCPTSISHRFVIMPPKARAR